VKVFLDQVREEPFRWDVQQEVPVASLDRPELLGLSPVAWKGEVVWADPGYLLRAKLDYRQELACIRCLAPIAEESHSDVDLMIVVDRRHPEPGEEEIDERDLSVWTVEEEVVELEPILFEQLQLNVPMKPLCRPDCKGLCPRCGADWNEGPCACAESPGEGRFPALAQLKGRLDDRADRG
jgi:uncharacterized protein